MNRSGIERYSHEELAAEMDAPFLCVMTGMDLPVLENQAAYRAGWLQHIQHGSAADVIRAALDAQRAADCLTGGGEDPAPSSRVLLTGETLRSLCSLRGGCSLPAARITVPRACSRL